MTAVWAHRGASAVAPENSMEAFRIAIEMGADGIELDVHPTKDGRVVVVHDETVDRTSTGRGRVADHTLDQLRAFSFSNGRVTYNRVEIPTLEDVLDLLAPTKLSLNIELKTNIHRYPGFASDVQALVFASGMADRVIYSSFNHYTLRGLQEGGSQVPMGLLYEEWMLDPWEYAVRVSAEAIHPYHRLLDVGGVVDACHRAGVRVHPWTVNAPDRLRMMFSLGVDAIITDVPDVALKLRDQHGAGRLA